MCAGRGAADQLEQILQKSTHVTMHLAPSLHIASKTKGQSFFLLPKDERSARLEGAQRSGLGNKPHS